MFLLLSHAVKADFFRCHAIQFSITFFRPLAQGESFCKIVHAACAAAPICLAKINEFRETMPARSVSHCSGEMPRRHFARFKWVAGSLLGALLNIRLRKT